VEPEKNIGEGISKWARRPGIWVAVAMVLAFVAINTVSGGEEPEELTLVEFEEKVDKGQIEKAEIIDRTVRPTIKGTLKGDQDYRVDIPADSTEYYRELLVSNDIKDVTTTRDSENLWLNLLFSLLPFLFIVGIFFFVMNQMQGGSSRVMSFGKARAKMANKDAPEVTFADVAGADEAVEELKEIRDFLADPGKFQQMGAKIPKGVLLFGPPGTGKTLLARAVAGEAGVPFFSISGSDFVEMFVGVGASRVRDLFEQAKSNAPAIVFVDEIDAVGRHRGAGLGGGHDEREQTLNQLLVEMDGFDTNSGVILIAATNRPDILDPALLRPGRFDRQIVVDRPDLKGRRAILEVHSKGKPLHPSVDLDIIARRTPGFTGADLANLMNEAALLTAREGRSLVTTADMEEAIDRVMAGPERKSRVMSEQEKRVIAFHEGGHALVGHALPHADPVHKISIIPRGRALGWTLTLPETDRYLVTRSELRDRLAMMLGGRTAEELIFEEPTTGAQDDIQKATSIARQMVTEFGMSDALGPIRFGQSGDGEVFLGRDFSSQPDYSDEVAARIDSEVRLLMEQAHSTARNILTHYHEVLDNLAERLIADETIERDEVERLFATVTPWTSGPLPTVATNGAVDGAITSTPPPAVVFPEDPDDLS
jgi:cell division protease FtsH